MSSNEDDYNDDNGGQNSKKRRIQRACDVCRRKKIRCDGASIAGNRCSNCITYALDCTYVEAAKKRGPPKGYVERLENRVEKLETLLRRICPDETVLQQLNASLEKDNWTIETPGTSHLVLTGSSAGHDANENGPANGSHMVTNALRNADLPVSSPSDDDEPTLILADNLKKLDLDQGEYRFFGKSSGVMLIQTAIELKNEYSHGQMTAEEPKLPIKFHNRRMEFWTTRPWERQLRIRDPPNYSFPEPELARSLINQYFISINIFLPVLHRPTFEREVAAGLHLRDDSFAATYLLVCAVGARFSDDPRVLLDNVDSWHSAGWQWFNQVQMVKKTILAPPCLQDLQFYTLAVLFLQGSSAPQSCWTMVGIGIRLAQDVGAHRRKVHRTEPSAEDELWKRAFWALVCIDRAVSAALGRPCAIQDEDFDLEFPIECDDEYWDHPDPEQRFKQPEGKPSYMSAFILHLKLNQVLAFSLRTIYSINKSKVLLGLVGQEWEQHIVAELDSALNKWVDSVPEFLRWDPNRENEAFFNLSAALFAAYYHIQILIHRPFIPSPSKPSPLSFPSLAICTNAARSCTHIIDVQRKRMSSTPPSMHMPAFTSGIVLLLSIWGGKRSGLSIDPKKEMVDVHKCMQVLRAGEGRWHSAGRLWDILYELASVGDLPLPQPSPPAGTKRERDPQSQEAEPITVQVPDGPRNIAGSRRVRKEKSVQQLKSSSSSTQVKSEPTQTPTPSTTHPSTPVQAASIPPQSYPLPLYSEELGRIPLHTPVTFASHPPTQVPNLQTTDIQHGYWQHNIPVTDESMRRMAHQDGLSVQMLDGSSNPDIHHRYQPSHRMDVNGVAYGAQPFGSDPATSLAAGMMFDTMASLAFNAGGYAVVDPSTPVGGMRPPMSFRSDGSGRPLSSYQPPQAGPSILPTNALPSTGGRDDDGGMNYYMDNDAVAMWSNAPSGYELDDWGSYINAVGELTQHTSGTPEGGSQSIGRGGIPR